MPSLTQWAQARRHERSRRGQFPCSCSRRACTTDVTVGVQCTPSRRTGPRARRTVEHGSRASALIHVLPAPSRPLLPVLPSLRRERPVRGRHSVSPRARGLDACMARGMSPAPRNRSACLVPLAVLVGACVESPGAPPASATAPAVVSVDDASARLAGSRCAHASACGDVGAGRPYASASDCTVQMQQSTKQDLARCSAGIDPARLAGCERRLHAESCRPLSTLSRMLACRADAVCANPLGPGSDQPSFTSEDVYGMYTPLDGPHDRDSRATILAAAR